MAINTTTNPNGVNVIVDGTFGSWETVTDANIQAEYGKAYILNGSSFQTVTLPQSAAGSQGKSFAVTGVSTELYKVVQNNSQVINGISWSTTPGSPNGIAAKHVNCSAIFIAINDSGTVFKVSYLAGYFTVNSFFDFTVNNDGQAVEFDGSIMIGSTASGEPVPGNITSTDGSVTVINGSGTIDLSAIGGIETVETSASALTAESQKGYILTGGTIQEISLPLTPSVGDIFALHAKGSGLFRVIQRAGEQIVLGSKETDLGVTGSIQSTNTGDAIYFICDDATGLWRADSGYIGSFIINGINNTAIGRGSGILNQGNNAISIGTFSGGENQGSRAVSIGESSGNLNQGFSAVSIGFDSGKIGQGSRAVSIGEKAGNLNQGFSSVSIGEGAGEDDQGINSVCLGPNAGSTNAPDNSVCIGSGCVSPSVDGRLAFGNSMDPVVALGTTGPTQLGYLNIDYNGTTYRIPLFDSVTDGVI